MRLLQCHPDQFRPARFASLGDIVILSQCHVIPSKPGVTETVNAKCNG